MTNEPKPSETRGRETKKVKPASRKKNIVQDWVEAILFAFVVAFIIRNYTFQNFQIPSSSMEESLLIGDYLVADKLTFLFSDPKQGDIVTFLSPETPAIPKPASQFFRILGPLYWDKSKMFFHYHSPMNIVKRVIGEPGDTVQIVNQKVYVNGEPYNHPGERHVDPFNALTQGGGDAIYWDANSQEYAGSAVNYGDYGRQAGRAGGVDRQIGNGYMGQRDNFGPVVVPKGAYFVMGDNRDMSKDSRYWGFLNRKQITGTPALIFFSVGKEPLQGPFSGTMHYIQKERANQASKSRIRFERMFKLIK